MTINDALDKLLKLALNNAELKEKLLATENAKEPMEEFCKISAEYGCEIKIGDLLALNETLWNNLLKVQMVVQHSLLMNGQMLMSSLYLL